MLMFESHLIQMKGIVKAMGVYSIASGSFQCISEPCLLPQLGSLHGSPAFIPLFRLVEQEVGSQLLVLVAGKVSLDNKVTFEAQTTQLYISQ